MIADEVMCGAGRCGTWRALEHDGVQPDLLSVAKGLAAGYQPLGAAICTTAIWDTIRSAHGAFATGHTFTGHTAACAAGVAAQRIVARDGLVDRVRANGPRLTSWLADALAGVEAVGDIRGRGHFIALELVADRASRAPFAAERQLYLKIRAQALDYGLICYPVGGNVDGVNGDIVILAPPYNCTDAELGEIVDKTARAIRQVLAAEGLA
jgi:adenosylmethionine-8-amino-7-oxononanoate aminotransferase